MAFAISAGAKIRTIATTIEEGFSLPKVEKFEELINERTKAILICNPNNPTGYSLLPGKFPLLSDCNCMNHSYLYFRIRLQTMLHAHYRLVHPARKSPA